MNPSVYFDAPSPAARKRIRAISVACGLLVTAALGLAVYALARTGQLRAELWAPFAEPAVWTLIGRGLAATVRALLACTVLSFSLGVLMAALYRQGPRWVRHFLRGWIELFRAIPSLLILLFAYVVFAQDFGQAGMALANVVGPTASAWLGLDQWQTLGPLVLAVTLYHSALYAEIVRGGLQAVAPGQWQAARALGMSSAQAVRLVLLPQAFAYMRPALVAESVRTIKATALGYAIGYQELLRTGQILSTAFHNVIAVSLVMMLIYCTLCGALSYLADSLQRRGAGSPR
ncbi:MAG: amino acid ABC transporter permease [Rhodocyclaceae bacterium]